MKSIVLSMCLGLFCLGSYSLAYDANMPVYQTNVQQVIQQPVPFVQVMVYQAPAYTVMVPVVVVQPYTMTTTTVWGYPYYPVAILPVHTEHRCRLFNINRY